MSEIPDPFAARPYLPPHARGEEPVPPVESSEPVAAAETPVEPAPEAPVAEPVAPTVPPMAPAPPSGDDDALTHRYTGPVPSSAPPQPTTTLPAFSTAAPAPAVPAPARRSRGRTLGSALAVAVLAAGAGVGGAAGYEAYQSRDSNLGAIDAPVDTDAVPETAVEGVAAKVRPSVVQINFRAGNEGGSGTGIIISRDGLILTNNHVVESTAKKGTLAAVFSDGTHASAKIIGRDPATDIAVIKVKGRHDLAAAELGTSSTLRVGQGVVVVGSPYGLESTVTSGIVSALNRPVVASHGDGDKEEILPGFQSDAAINLGNSGGPVVDLKGRVVGVVAAIRASEEGGSIGLGFAIPIDVAKGVSSQLIRGEKVEHAQIGVTVSPAVADDEITKIGAEIRQVRAGSAGAKSGLAKGDIITAVDGIPVASNDALVAAIRSYQPGQTVTVKFQRDGDDKTAQVVLGSDGGKDPN